MLKREDTVSCEEHGWRVEGEGWRVEGGGWRVEGGGWRAEGGGRRVGKKKPFGLGSLGNLNSRAAAADPQSVGVGRARRGLENEPVHQTLYFWQSFVRSIPNSLFIAKSLLVTLALSPPLGMASSASQKPAAGNDEQPDAAEPEQEDAVAGPKSRLKITVRLADIVQLSLIIGRSRFGEVKMAKSRQTDDIYALKALRKSRFVPLA